MSARARRRTAATVAVVLAGLALTVTGLAGAYSYWQSYYVHRGFGAVALVRGAHRGKLVRISFSSPALHERTSYLAYLPPGYSSHPRRRYPVYYLLHGSPGQPSVYLAIVSIGIRMDNLIREHRMAPMILVFPNGEIGGSVFSDSEWANTPTGAYENGVLDVVRNVDHSFRTEPGRAHRVIAGFSAGGYGAVNIALHHLGVFGNVQSWSGYYLQSRSGVFAHASPALLADNSPLRYVPSLAARLRAEPLRAFLFTGRDDNLSVQTIPMARALAGAGATVSYALYHGGHDWQLWRAHVDQMLELASRDATIPLTGGNGHASSLTPGVTPLPHGIGRRHHHRRHGVRSPRRGRDHRSPRLRPALGSGRGSPPPGTAPVSRAPFYSAATVPVLAHAGRAPHRHLRLGVGRLILGLLLALGSAALINLGFLLQHRGLHGEDAGGLMATLRRAWRSPTWLGGQALGWVGFAAQIVAVAIAPLSLVQSFAAGGLALSVPIAARLFGHHITRGQAIAVLVMALGLAVLPIGFGTGRDHLHDGALALTAGGGALLALALCAAGPAARALAAGIFYGVADAAIKAVSVRWSGHGAGALASVWTLAAAAGTFAGFLAFQAALREGSAITGISLMNALSAVVALAGGVAAFDESLGAAPLVVAGHLVAIAVVLGCVPVLAAAQAAIAEAADGPPQPRRRALTPTYDATGEVAAGGEHGRLDEPARAGPVAEQDIGEVQVARQRVGGLRGDEEDQGAEQREGDRPPHRLQAPGQQAGDHPGGQPGDDHPRQWLQIKARELQQGQRIPHLRTGGEPADAAQEVEPAESAQGGEREGEEKPDRDRGVSCTTRHGRRIAVLPPWSHYFGP